MVKASESVKAGLMESIADPVSKRYPVQLHWSADDAGWIATFPDLPGCSGWGATEIEALTEGRTAALAWLKAHKAAGNPLPKASQWTP
jgi:predicted RNase H-like HicB family nuclease